MSFLKKFFLQIFYPEDEQKSILLGKYSDRNKKPDQIENWHKAVEFYKNGDFLKSAEEFLLYILDSKEDNVKFNLTDRKIEFSFFQGSKIIYGHFEKNRLFAYSDVAQITKPPDKNLSELLLKENYNLKFCKFLITADKKIRLELNLDKGLAHPVMLYMSLRELAITADGFDDILIDEFDYLQPIDIQHIKSLDNTEKTIKIKYLKSLISDTLKQIKDLDKTKYEGAIAFLLLNTNYKIYYLISPEGVLLDKLKKIHNFYLQQNANKIEINNKVIRIFENVLKQSDEEISKSLYAVKGTFPVVSPVKTKTVLQFIQKEIEKTHWYRDNNKKNIAKAICEYIVGFIEFNFGIEPVLEKLFRIFWEVMNYKYFNELGINHRYVVNGKINFFAINHQINKITHEYKKHYPKFYFNTKHLSITNFGDFASSFLYELINSGLYED